MAITTSDFLMRDEWTDNENRTYLNIYYARCTAGTPSAQALINAFKSQMMPAIADILSGSMSQVSTYAESLTDTTDFISETGTGIGDAGGADMPSFVACNFDIPPSDKSFRHSSKRYGRLTETDVNGNAITTSSEVRFDAVATALFNPWDDAITTWQLMIPKRNRVSDIEDPTKFFYVLADLVAPKNIGEYAVSTQNSRKR